MIVGYLLLNLTSCMALVWSTIMAYALGISAALVFLLLFRQVRRRHDDMPAACPGEAAGATPISGRQPGNIRAERPPIAFN